MEMVSQAERGEVRLVYGILRSHHIQEKIKKKDLRIPRASLRGYTAGVSMIGEIGSSFSEVDLFILFCLPGVEQYMLDQGDSEKAKRMTVSDFFWHKSRKK